MNWKVSYAVGLFLAVVAIGAVGSENQVVASLGCGGNCGGASCGGDSCGGGRQCKGPGLLARLRARKCDGGSCDGGGCGGRRRGHGDCGGLFGRRNRCHGNAAPTCCEPAPVCAPACDACAPACDACAPAPCSCPPAAVGTEVPPAPAGADNSAPAEGLAFRSVSFRS